jgi:hypothetical protein
MLTAEDYRHWPNDVRCLPASALHPPSLLSAVSAAGFEMLTKRMAREIGRHGRRA